MRLIGSQRLKSKKIQSNTFIHRGNLKNAKTGYDYRHKLRKQQCDPFKAKTLEQHTWRCVHPDNSTNLRT